MPEMINERLIVGIISSWATVFVVFFFFLAAELITDRQFGRLKTGITAKPIAVSFGSYNFPFGRGGPS